MGNMQCNVEFGYQLSICSGTTKNLDRVGRSHDFLDANRLPASSSALNLRTLYIHTYIYIYIYMPRKHKDSFIIIIIMQEVYSILSAFRPLLSIIDFLAEIASKNGVF
jgi:hypothetical protein